MHASFLQRPEDGFRSLGTGKYSQLRADHVSGGN